MRPGSGGGELGRRREAEPVGADALDVAQEPGELDGKGSPKVGVDAVSLGDQSDAGQETSSRLLVLGACEIKK